MKTVSLKIDDNIFAVTEEILSKLKKPRNRYINEAIDFYNHEQKRLLLEEILAKESIMVREDSAQVMNEFEQIEYND